MNAYEVCNRMYILLNIQNSIYTTENERETLKRMFNETFVAAMVNGFTVKRVNVPNGNIIAVDGITAFVPNMTEYRF